VGGFKRGQFVDWAGGKGAVGKGRGLGRKKTSTHWSQNQSKEPSIHGGEKGLGHRRRRFCNEERPNPTIFGKSGWGGNNGAGNGQ